MRGCVPEIAIRRGSHQTRNMHSGNFPDHAKDTQYPDQNYDEHHNIEQALDSRPHRDEGVDQPHDQADNHEYQNNINQGHSESPGRGITKASTTHAGLMPRPSPVSVTGEGS